MKNTKEWSRIEDAEKRLINSENVYNLKYKNAEMCIMKWKKNKKQKQIRHALLLYSGAKPDGVFSKLSSPFLHIYLQFNTKQGNVSIHSALINFSSTKNMVAVFRNRLALAANVPCTPNSI